MNWFTLSHTMFHCQLFSWHFNSCDLLIRFLISSYQINEYCLIPVETSTFVSAFFFLLLLLHLASSKIRCGANHQTFAIWTLTEDNFVHVPGEIFRGRLKRHTFSNLHIVVFSLIKTKKIYITLYFFKNHSLYVYTVVHYTIKE